MHSNIDPVTGVRAACASDEPCICSALKEPNAAFPIAYKKVDVAIPIPVCGRWFSIMSNIDPVKGVRAASASDERCICSALKEKDAAIFIAYKKVDVAIPIPVCGK
jgi:uncharacterized protein